MNLAFIKSAGLYPKGLFLFYFDLIFKQNSLHESMKMIFY